MEVKKLKKVPNKVDYVYYIYIILIILKRNALGVIIWIQRNKDYGRKV